eukprot:5193987-Karenia_brevis.AAC.1
MLHKTVPTLPLTCDEQLLSLSRDVCPCDSSSSCHGTGPPHPNSLQESLGNPDKIDVPQDTFAV